MPNYPILVGIIDNVTGLAILAWLLVMVIDTAENLLQEIHVPEAIVQCMEAIKAVAVIIIGAHAVFMAYCTLQVVYDSWPLCVLGFL